MYATMFRMFTTLGVCVALLLSGCSTVPRGEPAPPVVSTEVRAQIGRLAVRAPLPPQVKLTAALDTKGKAAGKTALSAGGAWLGGTAGAAAETGEPITFALVLGLGLLTTPIVAAGGALYGASAADNQADITAGNTTIQRALDFTPQRLLEVIRTEFQQGVPVPYELVGSLSNAELRQRGFSTVLDVEVLNITSQPDSSGMHAAFLVTNEATLTQLQDHRRLLVRTFPIRIEGRAVSRWAANDGALLLGELDAEYARVAAELRQALFLRPSIRVQGLAPASTGPGPWHLKKVASLQPVFRWSAVDGVETVAADRVTYDIRYGVDRKQMSIEALDATMQFQPAQALQACKKYYWQVRARYAVFGAETSSAWSPLHRFKTPCGV